MARTYTLPCRDVMADRLAASDTNTSRRSRFHPLLLSAAGQPKSAQSLVTFIAFEYGNYVTRASEGSPTAEVAMQLGAAEAIPTTLRALITDDAEFLAAAISHYESLEAGE